MGIGGGLWTILQSFYENADSSVKWLGSTSEAFCIEQGVRQGGILSADLYKVYINQLLDRLYMCGFGATIGNIVCNAPTCADDLSTLSSTTQELQMLCSITNDYSNMERYELQPAKSVVMPYSSKRSKTQEDPGILLGDQRMPTVDKTTHVGVVRTCDNSPNAAIDENLQKARRTLYSLMSAGLHGENGLDQETCIHLFRTYVVPVMTYGLEIYLPSVKELRPLDIFMKKVLKQILSISTTAADPAPYILSGLVPVEALIHVRALSLFGNIALLDDSSVEKRLAYRQLTIHGQSGKSWFSSIAIILLKYGLPNPMDILKDSFTKPQWKVKTTKAVYSYWANLIKEQAETYSTLQFLSAVHYQPGKVHPLIRISDTQTQNREVGRLAVKTKLVTGTYSLQSTRAAFNNLSVDPTCLLCKTASETVEHFIFDCPELQSVRDPVIADISNACSKISNLNRTQRNRLEVVLDIYSIVPVILRKDLEVLSEIDRHCRRLCYTLHTERANRLAKLPTRKRHEL